VTTEALEPTLEVPPPLERGAVLAPGYEVVRHVSRGRALDVYEVWSDERHSRCAVKLLRPDCVSNERAWRRLEREGRLLAEFAHPHIVRAYETIERPDPMVVLEPVTGETLQRMLRERRRRGPLRPRGPRLSVSELAALGTHLCSAAHYLHARGWLHLDFKPANVIAQNGMAKVLDLSHIGNPGRGRKGWGTKIYMAPEQARGGVLSEATDVWAIGMILFKAATGRRPFDPNATYPQLERRAPRVGDFRRLPASLSSLIDACLEPEPELRPTTNDLHRGLDAHV